jgi:trimeric autotransporter adhesin
MHNTVVCDPIVAGLHAELTQLQQEQQALQVRFATSAAAHTAVCSELNERRTVADAATRQYEVELTSLRQELEVQTAACREQAATAALLERTRQHLHIELMTARSTVAAAAADAQTAKDQCDSSVAQLQVVETALADCRAQVAALTAECDTATAAAASVHAEQQQQQAQLAAATAALTAAQADCAALQQQNTALHAQAAAARQLQQQLQKQALLRKLRGSDVDSSDDDVTAVCSTERAWVHGSEANSSSSAVNSSSISCTLATTATEVRLHLLTVL